MLGLQYESQARAETGAKSAPKYNVRKGSRAANR
jgi:hypothetical protein